MNKVNIKKMLLTQHTSGVLFYFIKKVANILKGFACSITQRPVTRLTVQAD